MARLRFTADFDYRPTPMSTIAYKEGMELTVRRECADEAVAKGKAVEIDPPRKAAKVDEAEEDADAGRG
ncbi:hypothetical protein [Aquamicrobium sp. LC103]|uniref:hypothetical protein n=1 Tax=Aquamicrobium sp. LC103 TaxID=1120658 RepID=UPI00063ECF96|nr:hypothetical protein [Aquamicrobium sp. LC103]TKT78419.1 hypothetical protein XW59_012450 [Aquamicrobium sp. LC103]